MKLKPTSFSTMWKVTVFVGVAAAALEATTATRTSSAAAVAPSMNLFRISLSFSVEPAVGRKISPGLVSGEKSPKSRLRRA